LSIGLPGSESENPEYSERNNCISRLDIICIAFGDSTAPLPLAFHRQQNPISATGDPGKRGFTSFFQPQAQCSHLTCKIQIAIAKASDLVMFGGVVSIDVDRHQSFKWGKLENF
jgi:hypothetical protein